MVPLVKAAPDYCIYECQHGPDHDSGRKRKRRLKNTSRSSIKKIGCPARIVLEEQIRDVVIFLPSSQYTDMPDVHINTYVHIYMSDGAWDYE